MKQYWDQYRKLLFIVVAAVTVHFIKNLVADGQISDMVMTAVIAALAGKTNT